MYIVLRKFKDAENEHIYEAGDIFPAKGFEVKEARIKELSSDKNNAGVAMIAKGIEAKEAEKPKKKRSK